MRLCFLGNPDEQRATFLEGLAARDIPVDVYGRDWDKWLRNPLIRIFPAVYGVDMWKTLRRYRIQLNLMRIHNLDSHNMRTFEVPGIGGIMLAPDTREHRIFFEAGKEVFLYKDLEAAATQARNILQLPAAGAAQIRQQARQRSLDSGYSYKDRTIQALEKIKALYA
jgi:spore maturation protein CgeB